MVNSFEGGRQPAEVAEEEFEELRQVVYEIFFRNTYPKTLDELKGRLQAIAEKKGVPMEKLESEFMDYMGDEMANSVD
jgi:hypothetical protein